VRQCETRAQCQVSPSLQPSALRARLLEARACKPRAGRKTCRYQSLFGSSQHDPSAVQGRGETSGTRRQSSTRRPVHCSPSQPRPWRTKFDSGQIRNLPKYPSWRPLKFQMSTRQRSHVGAQVARASTLFFPSLFPPRSHGTPISLGCRIALISHQDLPVRDPRRRGCGFWHWKGCGY
jgi:hypothetical protein